MRDGVIVHPVCFAFMSADEMARASRKSDLYVHAARIEVEGLGAREALRHGVVPVGDQSVCADGGERVRGGGSALARARR